MKSFDVVVVGAGPAGTSAALLLARCCRRVLVVDEGRPRNAVTRAVHGFLTRDGIAPGELRRLARRELRGYGVEIQNARVLGAERVDEGFRVRIGGRRHRTVKCRRLLLATGLEDRLPDLPGLREQYGVRVHHCPYCDAYEHRGRRLAAYGKGAAVAALARRLANWSEDVLVCATGRLGPGVRAGLEARGITVEPRRLLRLEGTSRTLRLVFERGAPLVRDAMFVAAPHSAASALAVRLGSLADRTGCLLTGRDQSTRSPGLYAAGDATRGPQFAIGAAAEGTLAAWAINEDLLAEDARESSRPSNTAGRDSKSASIRRT